MEKQQADRLILQYEKKIFGFALEKMRNISQAEELASDIICEVYISLLKKDDIINVDGYVYRIARNVYANHVRKLVEGRSFEDITGLTLPYYDKGFEELENEETFKWLRREIGYLSERQRIIIYMHYYDKKSVAEIAQRLKISEGTVKWHLSDARETLKEEMMMERVNDTLAVNPIRFGSMGHNGYPGSKGDTQDMFDTQLKQNIAFACYYMPLTVEEIARKIGVPTTYVVDELRVLVEYGYLDKLDNSKNPKYRTNMYITDGRLFDDTEGKLRKEAAKFLCDKFYPKVFADFDAAEDNWGFSCVDNDKNFMKYTLVMLCAAFSFKRFDVDFDKFKVKRPDGGCFIAHAFIREESNVKKENPYWACGYMYENVDCELQKMQLDCRFASRTGGWRDNLSTDSKYLYRFIEGDCKPESIPPEGYKRLCDKGYIFDDKVQIMSYKLPKEEQRWGSYIIDDLMQEYVKVSEEVTKYSKEVDEQVFDYMKDKYPKHILPIVKSYSTNCLSDGLMVPYVIEEMLERGMLKPLTDLQKKSVLAMIMYREK